MPHTSDLSFYNWETQTAASNPTPNFQIIADNEAGLLFKNKRDRKVINVDPMEYPVRASSPHPITRTLATNLRTDSRGARAFDSRARLGSNLCVAGCCWLWAGDAAGRQLPEGGGADRRVLAGGAVGPRDQAQELEQCAATVSVPRASVGKHAARHRIGNGLELRVLPVLVVVVGCVGRASSTLVSRL